MGFSYLNGKRWAEVTREERFFCQRLFTLAVKDCGKGIFSCVKDHQGNRRPLDGQWEPAFEVCFYRDLWHLKKKEGPLYSPKRTFDLVFFSKKTILILEAKAQQGFNLSQLKKLKYEDRKHIECLTGVSDVLIYGLISSRYTPRPDTIKLLDGPPLKWCDLAKIYKGDEVLARADEVYRR